ncbi:MAG: hypothetical protein ACM3XM_17735 [Mycobacterium leprae]
MKQLWFLLSVMAVLMYAGFAIQENTVSATTDGAPAVANLELALKATGATAESVTITGWAAVQTQPDRAELYRLLGWTGAAVPAEIRELRQYNQAGQEYIGIRWVLTGLQCRQWERAQALVGEALKRGSDRAVTVQMEAASSASDLTALIRKALDAVDATERQAWSGPSDAIVAGRSARLPSSPYGVNVQVEARRMTGGRTRLSIAWPALRLDS